MRIPTQHFKPDIFIYNGAPVITIFVKKILFFTKIWQYEMHHCDVHMYVLVPKGLKCILVMGIHIYVIKINLIISV